MIMIEDELPEKENSPEIEESKQTPEEEGVESANDTFSKFLKGSES